MSLLTIAEIYQNSKELIEKLSHLEANEKEKELKKLAKAEISVQG